MTEQIKNILAELKAIQAKLPELRDLFWLEIDRYDDADRQRGEVFDEKFERQSHNLFRAINNFAGFIEKSFTPTIEEVARKKAIEKLRAEFPNFDDWNAEAKNALIEREIKTFLESKPELTDNVLKFSKRRIKEGLQNITILNGDNFSEEFLTFYNSLDPTPSTHNSQKFIVRNYLLEQGYDKNLVESIKGYMPKSAPKTLRVVFSDGTEIADNKATQTFVKTIEKIGIEKIVHLKMDTLVRADTNFEKRAQLTQINNCYVNTHSSTIEKKRFLDTISNRLNLDLKVEVSER